MESEEKEGKETFEGAIYYDKADTICMAVCHASEKSKPFDDCHIIFKCDGSSETETIATLERVAQERGLVFIIPSITLQ